MWAFQRQKKTPTSSMPTPSQANQNKEATCPQCNSSFKLFNQGARSWNLKPHQVCIDCYRVRRKKKCQQPGNVQVIESDPISQVSAIHHQERITPKQYQEPIRASQTEASSCYMNSSAPKMEHHIFTKGGWRRARPRDHPRLPITISLDQPTTIADKHHRIQVTTTAIADTGAQSDLWSLDEYLSCGFLRDDLTPVKLSLAAANRSPISLEGAFFAKLSVTLRNGQTTSSRSMVYVSNSVRALYLSYETLLNLGLLSQNFPSSENTIDSRTNDSSNEVHASPSINASRFVNNGCEKPKTSGSTSCSCPQRTAPPLRPPQLPFPCSPENNEKMKSWLLDTWRDTLHQTLTPALTELYLAWLVPRSRYMWIPLPHQRLHTPQQPYHSTGRRKCMRIFYATKPLE
eukprot:gene859-151_t